MKAWEQAFAMKMGALHERSCAYFDRFARDVLEPGLISVSTFLGKWKLEVSLIQADMDRRCFRFALPEGGYVLVSFYLEGLYTLKSDYAFRFPGLGDITGVRTTTSLRSADKRWAASCLQMALSNFVMKSTEVKHRQEMREVALV